VRVRVRAPPPLATRARAHALTLAIGRALDRSRFIAEPRGW
jgi:hypothetical protein